MKEKVPLQVHSYIFQVQDGLGTGKIEARLSTIFEPKMPELGADEHCCEVDARSCTKCELLALAFFGGGGGLLPICIGIWNFGPGSQGEKWRPKSNFLRGLKSAHGWF